MILILIYISLIGNINHIIGSVVTNPSFLFGTDPDRNRVTLKPQAVKQFPSVESHLGVHASYATQRKRRYEANKCGWTQPLFRKARDRGIN